MGFPPKAAQHRPPSAEQSNHARENQQHRHRQFAIEVSRMRSWVWAALGAAELLVNAVVHLGYAFYIFGTAVAADVAASLVKSLIASGGGVTKDSGVDGEDDAAAVLDGAVPPIVLVHGIFGFGKGVRPPSLLIDRMLCSPLLALGYRSTLSLPLIAEAGRAVVLRRRGGEGRPRAGAGPGLADQRPRQGS
jgi:hypothetical protein